MLDSQPGSANPFFNALRTTTAWIDGAAFGLLSILYQVFFNVASLDLFSNATIMQFYSRVQLILGVYMIFQLAMSIIKGIVNPDTFFKGDKNGAGGLITRVAISLILLTLLVPLNTPKSNEYEKQVNNSGLLFGTLYSLQHRILTNNTLGKLVLGTTDAGGDYVYGTDDNKETLKRSAKLFTSTILKCFYRINLIPEGDRKKHEDGKPDAIFNDNRVCKDWDDELLESYLRIDAEPSEILEMATMTCEGEGGIFQKLLGKIDANLSGSNYYYLAIIPFVSSIVAIAFCVVMLGFTVDIAIRTLKLAILRLLAPIPIISYMDPNGSKDGSLNAWVKALTSTYLDLFIRLILVYFVIFIIQNIMIYGLDIFDTTSLVGNISTVFIFLGLFFFAKQAPKFIKDILGIKSDSGNFVNSLAMVAGGVGMIGSFATGWKAKSEENAQLHKGHPITNFIGNAGAAAASAIGGGIAAGKVLADKNATVGKVLSAQAQRNAVRASHSTAIGRLKENAYGMVTGKSLADQGSKELENTNKAAEIIGKLKAKTEAEGVKNGAAVTHLSNGNAISIGGHVLSSFDYEGWEKQVKTATNGHFQYNGIDFNLEHVLDVEVDAAKKSQIQAWMGGGAIKTGGKYYAQLNQNGQEIGNMRIELDNIMPRAAETVRTTFNADEIGTYGAAIGAADTYRRETDRGTSEEGMKQKMLIANKQNKGK